MKTGSRFTFVVLAALAFVLSGCGGAAPAQETPASLEAGVDVEYAVAEEPMPAPAATMVAEKTSDEAASVSNSGTMDVAAASVRQSNRKIIKNAEIKLLVADSDIAIDRTTQVVGDVGAYIISSRIWYQPYAGDNYKYATITMGVPVDQFETALRRLRAVAAQVLDENASGEDVTDKYVDLQSQLGNLEATRDRIRTFLEQANSVEESLRVNQELSEIERQIEEIQGRMNYLSDRSAYSTITVNIEPELPEIIAPTPTPTAPPPTPEPWNPGDTFESSKETLTVVYQGIFDLMIWLLIVILPIFGPPIFVVWSIWYLLKGKQAKPTREAEEE